MKKHGSPWLSRSFTSGSATAILRTRASSRSPIPPILAQQHVDGRAGMRPGFVSAGSAGDCGWVSVGCEGGNGVGGALGYGAGSEDDRVAGHADATPTRHRGGERSDQRTCAFASDLDSLLDGAIEGEVAGDGGRSERWGAGVLPEHGAGVGVERVDGRLLEGCVARVGGVANRAVADVAESGGTVEMCAVVCGGADEPACGSAEYEVGLPADGAVAGVEGVVRA